MTFQSFNITILDSSMSVIKKIKDSFDLYLTLGLYSLRNPLQTPALVEQLLFDQFTRLHKKHLQAYQELTMPLEKALSQIAPNNESSKDMAGIAHVLNSFWAEVKELAGQDTSSIPAAWDADRTLGYASYMVCRLIKPRAVIETGVAHGITSAFILKALAENNTGHLYSIDLPAFKRGSEKFVGVAVPERLKDRWTLRLAPSSTMLPRLLSEVGEIGMFLHDSNHSYHNQLREYTLAWKSLSQGGVLLSDDVNATDAFMEFSARVGQIPVCIRQQTKSLLIGLLAKP